MIKIARTFQWRSWSSGTWLVIVLLVASLVTHFIWFGYPQQVVFDEVHFGKFVTAYCCNHQRIFDIHPPHAKLLIAGTAYLFGYRGGLSFEHIGQGYGEVAAWQLRLFPAMVGVLLPLVIYWLLRQLHARPPAAFFGGLLVVLDNSLTVQTRIIALDGLLLTATFGAIAFYLVARRKMIAEENISKSTQYTGAQVQNKYRVFDWRKEGWMFAFAGGLAGLAVGTKFTGLTALGLIVILLGVWLVQIKTWFDIRRWVATTVTIFLGAGLIYGLGWMVHFMVLTEPGDGDLWRKPQWEQPIMVSFWRETKIIHKLMYDANSGLTAEHQDASYWWTWPLVKTPVFYWQFNETAGGNRAGSIYFLPNPILWWGTSVIFMVSLLAILINGINSWGGWKGRMTANIRHYQTLWASSFLRQAWLPLAGYAISYIPLMRVTRALFLYHYLMPWMFSLLVGVLWLDRVGWITSREVLDQPKRYWIVVGIVFLAFVFFSPFTYGLLLPEEFRRWLFWNKAWM